MVPRSPLQSSVEQVGELAAVLPPPENESVELTTTTPISLTTEKAVDPDPVNRKGSWRKSKEERDEE